jgi:sugar transferase (PEP-CTERM/EpsH1 system associated)
MSPEVARASAAVARQPHILWVKTELLHPVDKGGRIRTYHMLVELRKTHRITYVCLDDGDASPDAVSRAQEYCHELIRVPLRRQAKGTWRFYLELARNLLSPLPYAVAKYESPALRREIERVVADSEVDVVVCDFLTPSLNVPTGSGKARSVLFQHNVEAMIWRRHAEVSRNPIRRAYMAGQWRRMKAHEQRECARFDRVVAVSPEDEQAMRADYRLSAVSSIPTGVDTRYFQRDHGAVRSMTELVFTGSMDWMPNQDAINHMVAEILPRIRERVPSVTLTVVGRNPPPAIRALADEYPFVTVTGSVPDVRPYLARGAVFVVPMRVGGGTRLKIYEAMAMGCPVVSTTIGAEGLPLSNGDTIILADDPASFADEVVALLDAPDTAVALADRAERLVRSEFGWATVAERFGAICVDGTRH